MAGDEVGMHEGMHARLILLGLGFVLALAPAAHAQPAWTPLDGRLMISLNGLAQRTSQELAQSLTPTIYGEQGTIETLQSVTTGSMVDVSVGARVWRGLGVSLAFTSVSSENDASAIGLIPHPLFVGQHRSFSESVTDLGHTQRAVHLQFMWMYRVPQVERLEVAVSAGPSFFRVTQALLEGQLVPGVHFSEVGFPFNAIRIDDLTVADYRANPVGGNVGIDVSYLLAPNIGAGLFWRYASAQAELDLRTGGPLSLDAGGNQIGGGLRLRF